MLVIVQFLVDGVLGTGLRCDLQQGPSPELVLLECKKVVVLEEEWEL